MKLFVRTTLLTIFVIALLAPAAALAQDECFGLSEADCALIMNVGPATPGSAAFSYTFGLTLKSDDVMSVTSEGTGNVTIDPTAEDPLKGFNLVLSATFQSEDEEMAAELRIIDGTLYLQDAETGQWKFAPLAEVIARSGISMDMMNPEMLAGKTGEMSEMLEELGPLADVVMNHYSIVRGADKELNGGTVAVFESNYDVAGLLADPELTSGFTEMIKAKPELLGEMGMGDASTMTEEEIEQAASGMGMFVMMFNMMLQEPKLSWNTYVNPETGDFAGLDLYLAMRIDVSAMGMGGGDDVSEPIDLETTFGFYAGDYGATFEYVVPDGAVEMSGEELDEMFGAAEALQPGL